MTMKFMITVAGPAKAPRDVSRLAVSVQVTRYTHCMSRYVRTSKEEAGLQAETQCVTASASIPSRFGMSKGHKTQTARTCKLS